jgi:acyl-CoA thioester hydrolase
MTTDVPFEMTLHVRWGDLDSNGHMANAAYLDACVDVRFAYFTASGFPPARFHDAGIGPVIFRDEVEYFRELRLLDPMRITLAMAGLSDDGSHFRLLNEYFRADGQRAARLLTTGSWFDLRARRLSRPPEDLAAALRAMPRAEGFELLAPKAKG